VLKKGQEMEVVILSIEPEKERISVGLKELTEDPWISEIPSRYALGDTITGKIVSIADFGLFVELEDGVEGLLHVSEVEKQHDEKLEDLFTAGAELSARIINVNPEDRKIDLSLKTMIG
jgi:small subunit ribosomal protein S1